MVFLFDVFASPKQQSGTEFGGIPPKSEQSDSYAKGKASEQAAQTTSNYLKAICPNVANSLNVSAKKEQFVEIKIKTTFEVKAKQEFLPNGSVVVLDYSGTAGQNLATGKSTTENLEIQNKQLLDKVPDNGAGTILLMGLSRAENGKIMVSDENNIHPLKIDYSSKADLKSQIDEAYKFKTKPENLRVGNTTFVTAMSDAQDILAKNLKVGEMPTYHQLVAVDKVKPIEAESQIKDSFAKMGVSLSSRESHDALIYMSRAGGDKEFNITDTKGKVFKAIKNTDGKSYSLFGGDGKLIMNYDGGEEKNGGRPDKGAKGFVEEYSPKEEASLLGQNMARMQALNITPEFRIIGDSQSPLEFSKKLEGISSMLKGKCTYSSNYNFEVKALSGAAVSEASPITKAEYDKSKNAPPASTKMLENASATYSPETGKISLTGVANVPGTYSVNTSVVAKVTPSPVNVQLQFHVLGDVSGSLTRAMGMTEDETKKALSPSSNYNPYESLLSGMKGKSMNVASFTEMPTDKSGGYKDSDNIVAGLVQQAEKAKAGGFAPNSVLVISGDAGNVLLKENANGKIVFDEKKVKELRAAIETLKENNVQVFFVNYGSKSGATNRENWSAEQRSAEVLTKTLAQTGAGSTVEVTGKLAADKMAEAFEKVNMLATANIEAKSQSFVSLERKSEDGSVEKYWVPLKIDYQEQKL